MPPDRPPNAQDLEKDPWTIHGHLVLRPADAVECGWSREAAEAIFRELFPGRDAVPAAELHARLVGGGDGAGPVGPAERRELFAQVAREMLDYRIERQRVVAENEPIRLTKVNLKRVKSELGVDVLRALARELGWTVREDEEGLTVPVEDLLPYFRRPVVRELLAAKRAQCGLPPAPSLEPSARRAP